MQPGGMYRTLISFHHHAPIRADTEVRDQRWSMAIEHGSQSVEVCPALHHDAAFANAKAAAGV
ncbi:hypothethical protein [Ralstonia solanacearum PSI07]|nr:hypothethical protein [Ralstonia solanacearum PSI07]